MLRSTWTNNLSKLGYPRPTFARVLAVLRTVRQTYATLNLRPCLFSILTNQGTGYFTRCWRPALLRPGLKCLVFTGKLYYTIGTIFTCFWNRMKNTGLC